MDEVSINDCVRPHYRMMIQEIVITRAYGNRFVLGNNKLLATQSRKVAVFMLTISAIEIKNLLFKVFFFSQISHVLKCIHPLTIYCQ